MFDDFGRVELAPLWIDHPANQPIIPARTVYVHEDRHDVVAWGSRRRIPLLSLHMALYGVLYKRPQLLPSPPFRYGNTLSSRVSSALWSVDGTSLCRQPVGAIARLRSGSLWRHSSFGWHRIGWSNCGNFKTSLELSLLDPQVLSELEVLVLGSRCSNV